MKAESRKVFVGLVPEIIKSQSRESKSVCHVSFRIS